MWHLSRTRRTTGFGQRLPIVVRWDYEQRHYLLLMYDSTTGKRSNPICGSVDVCRLSHPTEWNILITGFGQQSKCAIRWQHDNNDTQDLLWHTHHRHRVRIPSGIYPWRYPNWVASQWAQELDVLVWAWYGTFIPTAIRHRIWANVTSGRGYPAIVHETAHTGFGQQLAIVIRWRHDNDIRTNGDTTLPRTGHRRVFPRMARKYHSRGYKHGKG